VFFRAQPVAMQDFKACARACRPPSLPVRLRCQFGFQVFNVCLRHRALHRIVATVARDIDLQLARATLRERSRIGISVRTARVPGRQRIGASPKVFIFSAGPHSRTAQQERPEWDDHIGPHRETGASARRSSDDVRSSTFMALHTARSSRSVFGVNDVCG
jgi:hypothetical protein